jgi:hypothetical protein
MADERIRQPVKITDPLTDANEAGVDANGDLQIVVPNSVTPGTAAANLGKAQDDVAGATDTGVAVLFERDDAPAALTPADGDYVLGRVDANGRIHVTDPNAGAGTPTTPVVDTPALAAIAAGASSLATELRTTDLGGTTSQLAGLDVSGSAPYRVDLEEVVNDVATRRVTLFGKAGDPLQWRPPNKGYFNITFAANAGFDGWRATVTNLDNSQTTDFFATFYRED